MPIRTNDKKNHLTVNAILICYFSFKRSNLQSQKPVFIEFEQPEEESYRELSFQVDQIIDSTNAIGVDGFRDKITSTLKGLFGNSFGDQFYSDLAWGALMDTDIFLNTSSLTGRDRSRIRNANYAEDTNTDAKCSPCN